MNLKTSKRAEKFVLLERNLNVSKKCNYLEKIIQPVKEPNL